MVIFHVRAFRHLKTITLKYFFCRPSLNQALGGLPGFSGNLCFPSFDAFGVKPSQVPRLTLLSSQSGNQTRLNPEIFFTLSCPGCFHMASSIQRKKIDPKALLLRAVHNVKESMGNMGNILYQEIK